ncbi:MAG: exosortase-dependent surface protein XDP2 [Phormidesmis sp.]
MMNIRNLTINASIVASSILILFSEPAHAFSFTTHYTETHQGSEASQGDIFLNAITLEDGKIIDDFALISSANIISNDLYTGGNSGAASAEIGDLATTGIKEEQLTNEGAKAVMNNLNLNNIIDTEDAGHFILDFNFEQAVDNIFIWERGMNSRLDIQALDADGNLIGNKLELSESRTWDNAGFQLDTKEIEGNQAVGSIGVNLADLGLDSGYISSLRVSSEGAAYNGPDFKILGSVAENAPQSIPEPSVLLGLGAIIAGIATHRRRAAEAAA